MVEKGGRETGLVLFYWVVYYFNDLNRKIKVEMLDVL